MLFGVCVGILSGVTYIINDYYFDRGRTPTPAIKSESQLMMQEKREQLRWALVVGH